MSDKIQVPGEWREWWRLYNRLTSAQRLRCSGLGLWPGWIPPWWVELTSRIVPEEVLLWQILEEWPPIEEVRARTEAELEAIKEKSQAYRTVKEEVMEKLAALSKDEQRVLVLRFGLEDGRSRSLKETGREIGRSPSTVRRIEQEALARFRSSPA